MFHIRACKYQDCSYYRPWAKKYCCLACSCDAYDAGRLAPGPHRVSHQRRGGEKMAKTTKTPVKKVTIGKLTLSKSKTKVGTKKGR